MPCHNDAVAMTASHTTESQYSDLCCTRTRVLITNDPQQNFVAKQQASASYTQTVTT